MIRTVFVATSLLVITPLAGAAQQPAAPEPVRVGARVGESASTYEDGGRRDPFASLIVPKVAPSTAKTSTARPRPQAGLGGVSVTEVTVKGVVRSGTTMIALLQAPDGRTYMAKRQDRLQDGVVTSIDPDGVVFTARTEDAAGVVRARDVRKALRASVAGGVGGVDEAAAQQGVRR